MNRLRNLTLELRTVVIAAALVAVVIVGAIITFSADAPSEQTPQSQPCKPDDCSLSGASAEQVLADRYAPVMYLKDRVTDCSLTNGDFRPIPVEAFLTNPRVDLRSRGSSEVVRGPTAGDVFDKGRDYFLDLPGDPRRPGCRYLEDGRAIVESAHLPYVTYAHIAYEDGYDNQLVLQYWFFYYFNQWNNKHEGDWEMMQLAFDAGTPQEALSGAPVRIAYSQHSGGEIAPWDDDKVEKEGDHPVTHVAAGSHSNRYGPEVYLGRGEDGAGFGCDDASGKMRLLPAARLTPDQPPAHDDTFAWLTFQGHWGQFAGPEFDGPTGPNMKTQWTHPFSWESKLRTSSVHLPSTNGVGVSAVQAFCSVVSWGSNALLPLILLAPAASIAVIILTLFGFAVALTRTGYLPPLGEPLARRRRFGQILTSSFDIYRRNSRLFVGIGLIYLPVWLLVTGAHWLLMHVSPVETIGSVPRGNVVQNVAIAFALAELQLGVAYAAVIAATTAALDDIDDGDAPGVRRSYLRLWRHSWQLAVPRFAGYVMVTALAFTIVGIPLAVRQAVRWNFLEQTILFDDTSSRGSFDASSRVVSTAWWWAAAATFGLSLVGLFAGPALGVILILSTSRIPLSDVNLITSLIHAALVPYVAIALALVFFDLKAKLAEQTSKPDAA